MRVLIVEDETALRLLKFYKHNLIQIYTREKEWFDLYIYANMMAEKVSKL